MEKGYVSSIPEAFQKYIGEGCPGYISHFKLSTYEAVDLITKSQGVAVLAHPAITNKDELIPSFVDAGLKGIEVYYPNQTKAVEDHYKGIARKYGLITTGGSDAHGDAKKNTFIGKARIDYQIVEQLKNCC